MTLDVHMNKAGKLTAWESFSSEISAETALIVMTVSKLTCFQHIDMHVLGKKRTVSSCNSIT